jgi:small subunit ribosomal protein S8
MNNQDPIADMLTRIRNANRVGRRNVVIPKSKICLGIAAVLKEEGYIEEFEAVTDEVAGTEGGQLVSSLIVIS